MPSFKLSQKAFEDLIDIKKQLATVTAHQTLPPARLKQKKKKVE